MCQGVSLTEAGGSAQFIGESSDRNCSVLAVTLDGLPPGPQEVSFLRRSAIRRTSCAGLTLTAQGESMRAAVRDVGDHEICKHGLP